MYRSLKAMLLKLRHGHKLECIGMRGFQDHGRCHSCLQRFAPTHGAQTPAVPRIQPGKTVLGNRRDQVVARSLRKFQEFCCDPDADQVRAVVAGVGIAAAIAKVTGQRVVRARHKRGAENIFCIHIVSLFKNSWPASDQAGLDCTIFIAEVISAETSVMLLGTIKVVVASLATCE